MNKWTREEFRLMNQWKRKLMIITYISEMTLTDHMCQEEKEEEDLPALKINSFNKLKTT